MEDRPTPALPTDVPPALLAEPAPRGGALALLRFMRARGMLRPACLLPLARMLRLRLACRGRLRVEGVAFAGRDVLLEVDRGAGATLGHWSWLGGGSRIRVREGVLEVGPGALLGRECAISVRRRVSVGAGCLLGDRAMLVDFDHVADDVERPIRLQGVRTAEVRIGDGARLGPQACLLRGVTVGAGAVVEPMAVVTRDVPAGSVAGGVPARSRRGGAAAPASRGGGRP